MKIGLVCPYNIFLGGGVQEVVLALREGLATRGHQARIITPLPRGHRGVRPKSIIFLGTAANLKSPFHTTAQVSVSLNVDAIDAMLQREQFDILHFHEPWVPIMSRQLLSRSNSHNVATFHAKLPETIMSRTIERVITPYTKSIIRYLGTLTAVSEPAAEYVRGLTSAPVTIVPNGIDLQHYAHKAKQSHQRKTILYVGRLEKRKGVKYLLRTFARLAETDKNVYLVIAGDGPDRKRLVDFVQTARIPRVRFTGFVTDKQKRWLYSRADLFCSPALYGESFGIVLLEAMAAGLVTVAGNNPGYAAVLQGKGALSLVNPKDTLEFARRLALLLYDDELRAVWRTWAETYTRQFAYPNIISQYEQIYQKAIKK